MEKEAILICSCYSLFSFCTVEIKNALAKIMVLLNSWIDIRFSEEKKLQNSKYNAEQNKREK